MDRTCQKLVELENVKKKYGSLPVLEDISLHLSEGEIVSIVGPSGCGKTTILNIVAGLVSPEQGKVRVAGGKTIGYVFQEPRLIPWRNVEQNIVFVQKNCPLSKALARETREQLIGKVGMKDFVHYFPSQLSGGMQQRVSLIRALAIMPHILLLDEPFKCMDDKTISVIEKIVRQMDKEKRPGILMVTHDYRTAMRLTDRVYLLSPRPAKVVGHFQTAVSGSTQFFPSQPGYHLCFSGLTLEKILTPARETNLRRERMKLRRIIDSLRLEECTLDLNTDITITGCHVSDVMSETLANASRGDLWITQQNNPVVVALASLKKIPVILLVGNKKPTPEMIARAEEERIVILTTSMSCFEMAGRLYQLGLSGTRDTVKTKSPN